MTRSETGASAVPTVAGTGIESWFTPGRFSALLALLICLTFLEVVTGQQTFFYRDFGVFTYPVAHYQRECFWRGELPLWNPLNDCGLPLLAQWNTATLYPLDLFYLVLPLTWSLGVFGLGHLFLAGLGMYFLARRWTGNPLAAALAGMAFAYNGLSWHSLVWISNLAAWAWMPWVVLAVERAWREGGRYLILAALAGALQMLSGSPEIIVLTWVVLGGLWVLDFFSGETSRGKMAGRVLAVGGLVAGLAAAQILPFLDLLRHSNRDTGFANAGWSMPASGPANFLVPLFRCFVAAHGVFVQVEQYWTPSHYIGIGIVALALVALGRVRQRRVWFLAAAAILGIVMALGDQGYLYPKIKAVLPQLGFMRYPIKFVVLTLFALPLLAAYGVNWFFHDRRTASLSGKSQTGSTRAEWSLGVVVFVLLGLIVVILLHAGQHPVNWENWPATFRNGLGRAAILILIFGALAQLRRQPRFKMQLLMALSLLLLQWVDIFTHAPKINPTVEGSVFEPGVIRTQMKMAPLPEVGEPRARPSAEVIEKVRYLELSDPIKDYLCRRVTLYDDCNLLDDIPKTDGFFSLYLREYDQIQSLLLAGDMQHVELKGLKDFLGVKYASAPLSSLSSGLDWTERDSFLPLVTAGQKPVFADGADVLMALGRRTFDPRATVYLPAAAGPFITATNQASAKVIPGRFAAQRLDFEVDADTPALVTVAQAFYHPWQAYVDGQRTRLWEANFAFQALEVPAGRHQVSIVYEDRYFFYGVVISLVTLLGCGLLWVRKSFNFPRNNLRL